ncbi:MAG: hypothetical protein RIR51_2029 [Bacteroidota bacterium]|jgi:hypothetical protein
MKSVTKFILIALALFLSTNLFSQVKISTENSNGQVNGSAALEVESSDKGLLLPRLTTTQRNAIQSPSVGLVVYDITTNQFMYYNGSSWVSSSSGGGGTGVPYTGATANVDLGTNSIKADSLTSTKDIIVNGLRIGRGSGNGINQAFGQLALNENTNGYANMANGFQALTSNTTGNNNTAIGSTTLSSNISGNNNTANGYDALYNSTGSNNTALGSSAGTNLTSGNRNIAIGSNTNFPSATSSYQLNIGNEIYGKNVDSPTSPVLIGIGKNDPTTTLDINGSLKVIDSINVNGIYIGRGKGNDSTNQAFGQLALNSNTTGYANLASGFQALSSNISGNNNTANGYEALNNSTGSNNTALGSSAGTNLTSGNNNIAIGSNTNFSSATNNYQLNIGNEIYGKNVDSPTSPVLIGIGKNDPTYTLDINGTARIDNVPTISNATKALVKDPSTGQISEQLISTITNNLIPYTGAIANVDLGPNSLIGDSLTSAKDIKVNGLRIGRGPGLNNEHNTTIGYQALNSNLNGQYNTAYGYQALYSNISGNNNTSMGYYAGRNLVSGIGNIAIGASTNFTSTTGNYQLNIGNGIFGINVGSPNQPIFIGIGKNNPIASLDINGSLKVADTLNVGGIYFGRGNGNINTNIAIGLNTLINNTGYDHLAIGENALINNTTSYSNLAIGHRAQVLNTTGGDNVAYGHNSLFSNNGSFNTAIGNNAFYYKTTGSNNIALGFRSGINLTSGSANIAIGYGTIFPSSIGSNQLVIGNILFGQEIYSRLNGQIAIGTFPDNSENRLIVGGNISSSGNISATGTVSASGVVLSSDRRFKKDIQSINLGLKEVLQLKPSSYYWNTKNERMTNADPTKLQYGFIAQELEAVIPAIVSGDGSEKDYKSVNYEALIPVLTKAIQEQQALIQTQQSLNREQQEMIDALNKRIEILEKGKSEEL